MRSQEFEAKGSRSHSLMDLENRFEDLGITAAQDYFLEWIYRGVSNLGVRDLDRYEAAFWLINSVLPPAVTSSYGRLPRMYRAMNFGSKQIDQIYDTGLPIKSKIMAWTPDFKDAFQYLGDSGVVIAHKPKQKDVILALNSETVEFLHVPRKVIANSGEAILSLPLLAITPKMVVYPPR